MSLIAEPRTVAVLARSGVGSSRGVQWRGLSCAALAGDRRERCTSLESDGGRGTGPGPDEVAKGAAEWPAFDTSVAHIARVYDYWLGGKDNFAADRAAAEQAIAAYPDIVFSVRANRAFLARAVRYLAGEAGIRQFLDIGTGIPSSSNTHEVAQSVAPESRVAYVDNDPVVLAHARALLTSGPHGVTSYLDADLRDTETILDAVAPGSFLVVLHAPSDIRGDEVAEMARRYNATASAPINPRPRDDVARFF